MNHPSDDELAEYAAEPEGKVEVASHLATCDACRERVAEYERIDDALRSPENWTATVHRIETRRQRNAAFAEAERLDAERSAADAALQPLLANIVLFTNANVTEQPVFRTIGGVSVLTSAVRAARDRQPQFAVRMGEAAVTVARRLAKAEKPEPGAIGAYGRALLEYGIALFLTGSYRDAEKALKAAEEVYEEDRRSTGWDVACVWLALANVYVETERPKEAEILAVGAARRFLEYGDVLRHLMARLINVQIGYGRGMYDDALVIAQDVIGLARRENQRYLLGTALMSAGLCYVELAEYESAAECFSEALPIWDEAGADLERSRAEWALAHLDLRAGKPSAAIPSLEALYSKFEMLGANNNAAFVRLDLAEALLLMDEPDRIPSLLSDVVLTFSSERRDRLARTALAYISEAAAARRLRSSDIRHVRVYLQNLTFGPLTDFAPLQ